MTDKTFTIAGVSMGKNGYKVRFANDMSRVKILAKTETDINLIELPHPMDKPTLVTYLKTTELYNKAEYREAINTADDKYNGAVVVVTKTAKSATKSKSKPSMDDLKARAVAKAMVEDTEEA